MLLMLCSTLRELYVTLQNPPNSLELHEFNSTQEKDVLGSRGRTCWAAAEGSFRKGLAVVIRPKEMDREWKLALKIKTKYQLEGTSFNTGPPPSISLSLSLSCLHPTSVTQGLSVSLAGPKLTMQTTLVFNS